MPVETRERIGGTAFTPEQRQGIELTGQSLLVSAAAGSGKTTVLAERCVYLVCDANPVCDVDELLVVTFTEEAAGQMRARITQALRQRAAKAPSDRLDRQLALIDRAQISTLHAFCARLLRQHFHLVGLDPGFKVLDADDARLRRREVARDLFDRSYDQDDEQESFHSLIDDYGDGNDEKVINRVLHVHELLTSVADPRGWIGQSRQRIIDALSGPFEKSELGRELIKSVGCGLSAARARCTDATQKLIKLNFPGYAAYVHEMGEVLEVWEQDFEKGGIDALARVASAVEWGKLPSASRELPNKDLAFSIVEGVRNQIKCGHWRDLLKFSVDQWRHGLALMQPHAEIFLALVEQFGQEYDKAKKAARAVDFADLERYALAVLNESTPAKRRRPSPTARAYHQQFAHVLVDEYQDINEVQDAILSLVSRECLARTASVSPPAKSATASARKSKKSVAADSASNRASDGNGSASGRGEGDGTLSAKSPGADGGDTRTINAGIAAAAGNLFCVGDVKQSIYRFRLAEPGRFLDRQRQFREPASHGRVIDLRSNFRSRRPLLEAINAVFERLMVSDAVDIQYDESHRLRGEKEYPDADENQSFFGAPIDFHVLAKEGRADGQGEEQAPGDAGEAEDLEAMEREALLIAQEILRIVGRGKSPPMQVWDEKLKSLRPARFGDIAILLRAMKFKADLIAGVLRQFDINVHFVSGAGYFESMEVRDMLALLTLLDNQRQDIPLAAFLRGPLGQLPDPETNLAQIRLAYPAKDAAFHEAARRYSQQKDDVLAHRLREIFARITRWRQAAQTRPLAEVIWTIYRETGLLAYVAGLRNGEQRVANLLYLHERASQFGEFQSRGLSRFMRFIEDLRDEADLGQPGIESQAQDVVRLMSVHKSKGLEFPIVILPDLGKRINLKDAEGAILADRKAGLGMKAVDEQKRCRYPSLASALVAERLAQQSLAEELRVLYVAMTRAREHLILVGACSQNTMQRWHSNYNDHTGAFSADMILGARTMLDWLGPVSVATHTEPPSVLRGIFHPPEEVQSWHTPAARSAEKSALVRSMIQLNPLPDSPATPPQAAATIQRVAYVYPYQMFTELPGAQSVTRMAGHGATGGGGATATREIAGENSPPASVVAEEVTTANFDGEVFYSLDDIAVEDHALPDVSPKASAGGASASGPMLPTSAAVGLLPEPRFRLADSAISATERGTATHLVLQHLRFSGTCDAVDINRQIDALVEKRILTPALAAVVDRDAIAWFMATPLGAQMRQNPASVRRELALNFPAATPITTGPAPVEPMDRIMVRGRIDTLILGADGDILLDYKTDRVTPAQVAARAAVYQPQVRAYRDAILRITQRPVTQAYLAFLGPRVLYPVD